MSNILNGVLGAILAIVLLGATIGIVTDNTIGINSSASNVTGTTKSLANVLPIFYVIGFLVGTLALFGLYRVGRGGG